MIIESIIAAFYNILGTWYYLKQSYLLESTIRIIVDSKVILTKHITVCTVVRLMPDFINQCLLNIEEWAKKS